MTAKALCVIRATAVSRYCLAYMAAPRILLLEPDPAAGPLLAHRLREHGMHCDVAASGLEGWRQLAVNRPDMMLLGARTPELPDLMRRLRDEYMAVAPDLVALTSIGAPRLDRDYPLRAVVMRPAEPQWLGDLANQVSGGAIDLNLDRLREMLCLTTLGSELQDALDRIAHRLRLLYGVASAVIVANAAERQWVGTSSGAVALTEWPRLWQLCAQALDVGAPLIVSGAEGPQTRIAAPLRTAQHELLGAICLFANGARLASSEAREALDDLAARLGTELAWRSIHTRVAGERDRLREAAMFDPLLGVSSRAALDQSMATEIARHHRTKSPLSLAVLNIEALRVINDRYGHLAGDAVLRHVAQTSVDLVRPHDLVGRVGGDEIAIILGDTDAAEARTVIARILTVLRARPFSYTDGDPIPLTVRAGVAEFAQRDHDASAWLARATEASEAAKHEVDLVAIAKGDNRPQTARQEIRFEPGVTLAGMYEIVHEISRGAMGVVYRAEDLGLSRPVAIKMLRPDLVREPGVVDRFRGEAGILASLSHENLVRIYSLVEADDDVFFVMELVEGVSLHSVINDFIARNRYLSRDRVGTIVSQIASALDAMHNAGVMHRDVKPSNVVLDRARDRAVLLDVGLARRVGSQSDAAGTPGYVAPESFRGGTETPATDVYGLAATAYTLLLNRAPFGTADDVRDILRRQLKITPQAPSELRADINNETDIVMLRAITLDPQDRYATAGEFARAFVDSLSSVNPEFQVPTVGSLPDYLRSATPDKEHRPNETLTFLPALAAGATGVANSLSRGLILRAAAKLFAPQARAREAVSAGLPALTSALSAQTAPGAWLNANLFTELLEAVDLGGYSRQTFASELGSLAVQLSFHSFYPTSPESLSPDLTLSAADVLWRRYHNWGGVNVEIGNEGQAAINLIDSPNAFVCSFVRGWLSQIIIESGGADPSIQHPQCLHNGGPACSFEASWRRI